MKAIKLVAVAILGATTLGVVTPAFAGEVVDSKKTDTTVLIEDAGEGTTADLKLKEVPTKFDFKTALRSDGKYGLTDGTSTGKFVVFNNKMKQEWSVKSTVDGAELKLSNAKVATVEGFRIDGQELVGTSATGIVFKNAASDNTNTGDMQKDVTEIAIDFSTTGNVKAGDTLTGKISHQLYNTVDAK